MKQLDVAAAIIVKDNKILATQRKSGEFKDGWEFPGGKLEPGENSLDACRREIREELDVEIGDEKFLVNVGYDYPSFRLNMDCYFCRIISGDIALHDHEAMRWLSSEDIDSVGWLPADIKVVEAIKSSGVL